MTLVRMSELPQKLKQDSGKSIDRTGSMLLLTARIVEKKKDDLEFSKCIFLLTIKK